MNTGLVHSTGALLLEPMNQMVIEVKLQHKAPIPLTFNTPAEKLRCELAFTYTAYMYVCITPTCRLAYSIIP